MTDAGLKDLAPLKHLQWLNIVGTQVTEEGMADLQKSLPTLHIRRYKLRAEGNRDHPLVAADQSPETAKPAPPKPPVPPEVARHNQWVGECLKEIKTIKPGMTRKDLLSVFTPAGGLYFPTTPRIYHYKSCSYFLIKVTFEGVDQGKEQPGDKIVEVSLPYLDYPPID